jgi:hypothetical protein
MTVDSGGLVCYSESGGNARSVGSAAPEAEMGQCPVHGLAMYQVGSDAVVSGKRARHRRMHVLTAAYGRNGPRSCCYLRAFEPAERDREVGDRIATSASEDWLVMHFPETASCLD